MFVEKPIFLFLFFERVANFEIVGTYLSTITFEFFVLSYLLNQHSPLAAYGEWPFKCGEWDCF